MSIEIPQYANDPFADVDPNQPVVPDLHDAKKLQEVADALISSTTVAQPASTDDITPPDCTVTLPGGLIKDDELHTLCEVRELTGEDEEAIAKSGANFYRFISTILERGVVKIGGVKAGATVLRDLLIGDREALLLGVRIATFGNTIEINNITCPECGEYVGDVEVDLTKIPVTKLDDPMQQTFSVALRKGDVAIVRLPNGHDQQAIFQNDRLSAAEQNTLLLSRTVISINGAKTKGTTTVQNMGIADRRKILEFLTKTQPGPRYDEETFEHESCGNQVKVSLTVVDLFRGF